MNIVKINDLDLLRFCHAKIVGKELKDFNGAFPADECVCFGEYHADGEPKWSAVLYKFKKNHDCLLELAMNLRGLFSRKLFEKMARVVFDYAFNQAKLLRMSTQVRVSNKKSIRITKAWGFEQEGLTKSGYGPPDVEDMVNFGLLRGNCKWI